MTRFTKRMILLVTMFAAVSPAAALDMESIWLGTPFMEGWVPADARTLRGVLVMNGWPNDGRWREAAKYWKFAVLRINTDGYGGDDIPDDPNYAALKKGNAVRVHALAKGLEVLAQRTGHPELKHVPIVASGFSRYSNSASQFMAAFPKRALCFMNGNGGGSAVKDGDSTGALIWQKTPSLGLQNEWENIFSGGDKTKLLPRWWRRPKGNKAAAAIHWRVYHNPKTFADLGIVFIDQVIRARIPADWDPARGPAKLKPLSSDKAWLGSHEGWHVPVEKIFQTDVDSPKIAPIEKFTGDRERTSWLISEEFAWNWRAYSSRYPKARIIQPGHSNLVLHQDAQPAPLGHLETGVRAGKPFPVAAISHVPDLKSIEFFANNISLGKTTRFTGGETALGNTVKAIGGVEATIKTPGIYGIMARYTTTDDATGWTRPMPMVVWPTDENETGQPDD